MAITETSNTNFERTVILWKVADALRILTLCTQKLSEGANKNDTPESR